MKTIPLCMLYAKKLCMKNCNKDNGDSMGYKDYIKRTLKNKYLYTFFMSIVSYITLLKKLHINTYSFLSFLLFFILFFFFYKIDYTKIKGRVGPYIYAFVFAVILMIGDILYPNLTNPSFVLLKEIGSLINIIYLFGYSCLLYAIFALILPFLFQIDIKEKEKKRNTKKIFFRSFFTIFLFHLPYFLAYFPANMTSDTLSEFAIFIGNFSTMTDHHPVFHYVFMSLPYNLGMFLFHNTNIATSFVTMSQMLIMALIFAYTVTFLYQKSVKTKYCIGLTLFYAIIPVYGFYSTILWKDILFSGLFLLFVIELIKLTENIEHRKIKDHIRFIIISLFMLLFRNNAIYMYLFVFLCSLVVFRKQLVNIIIIFGIVIGSYFMIKGPIFHSLSIEKPSSKEYIAIPLQQVGRLAYKGVTFTKEEKELLNKLIDIRMLRKKYNPQTVDAIKFDRAYHANALDENMEKYVKLYINLILKHPVGMIEGYLVSTLGFYYPNVYYEPVALQIDKNEWEIERASLLDSRVVKQIEKLKSFDLPLVSCIWSIGIWFWTLFFFLYIAYVKKGIRGAYPFIAVVALWFTIMIATPLYVELRYVYGVYTTLPLLVLYTLYLQTNKKVRSRKNEK